MEKTLESSLILAGSGRSGTTWIGEVLASCAGCCPVFEPLHQGRVDQLPPCGQLSGYPGKYRRYDEAAREWRTFFNALFQGRVSNAWTRQDWTRAEAWPLSLLTSELGRRAAFRIAAAAYRLNERISDRYVVKLIRGNLLLGWLTRQFSVRVCFLTRHPCAVVGSRLRLDWSHSLDDALAQPALVEDHLDPHRSVIEAAKSPLEKMAVLWCIENLVPLAQLPEQNWTTCSYEACVAEPHREFGRLIDELGLEPTRKTQKAIRRLVSTPSADAGTTRAWHHPLSEADGKEVLRICEEFGIGLYGPHTLPMRDIRNALTTLRVDSICREAVQI